MKRAFLPEKIGTLLSEVEIQYSGSGNQRVTTQWFRPRSTEVDADVLVWMDNKENIIKQQVSISGVVVEWNILDGMRTGVVIEQELKESQTSETIQFDSSANAMSVGMASQLLGVVPSMDEKTRRILLENLTQPRTFSTMSPHEILYRYGRLPPRGSLSPVLRQVSFFRRLLLLFVPLAHRLKVYLRRLLS